MMLAFHHTLPYGWRPLEMTAWRSSLVRSSKHASARSNARQRGHRTAVSETPPSPAASPDYADAFEVTRIPTDQRSAEQWARDGFERLPLAARRSVLFVHRWVLGFLSGGGYRGGVLGASLAGHDIGHGDPR
jgi:hypothetical protein